MRVLWLWAAIVGLVICPQLGCSNGAKQSGNTKQSKKSDAGEDTDGATAGDDDTDDTDGGSGGTEAGDEPSGDTDTGADDDGATGDTLMPALTGDILAAENLDCDKDTAGWHGKVYDMPSGTNVLPDFAALTPFGQVSATTLAMEEKTWQGFPSDEDKKTHFAIRFVAVLDAPEDGKYFLRLSSDDGSRLIIDDKVIMNYDRVQPFEPHDSIVDLAKGAHKIEIRYFQSNLSVGLKFDWMIPSSTDYVVVPSTVVKAGRDCDLPDEGAFE